jgi:long-chain acyl-CoA synthetase
METLRDLFEHVVSSQKGRKQLLRAKRKGRWVSLSTEEFADRVQNLAGGLIARGVRPGDPVALYSENRPEWHILDFACHHAGAVLVPMYPNLIADQIAYIVKDSGARWLFVSTPAMLETAREAMVQVEHGVELVLFDGDGATGDALAASVLEDEGRAWRRERRKEEDPFHHPGKDDLASLIYTSGTTGDPKGVMLTHYNFVFDQGSALSGFDIGPKDVVMSFLPLSHVFERTVDYALFSRGAQICYVESIERVPTRLLEVRPTMMVSVPRLFERSYIKIISKLRQEEGFKRRLIDWALATARRYKELEWAGRRPPAVLRAQYALARKRVFSKILERLGGRLRFAVSGGAPLSREVAEFFDMIGLTICQGYGLTESSPVISVNTLAENRLGSVGKPIPGVEVRIAEDGEILTRGSHVMKGYFNQPEATAEAIDEDGWLHTGDVGYLDADGFLFITDRKKDIIVTSGGKNIAPQPIEGRLQATPYIAQAVLVGDNLPYLTALIVPNFENLTAYFAERGEAGLSPEEMAAREETRQLIDEAIRALNAELAQHEKIRRFTILSREFSMAEGEITPTLKVRRRVVSERYKDLIDGMYLKTQRADQYHAD